MLPKPTPNTTPEEKDTMKFEGSDLGEQGVRTKMNWLSPRANGSLKRLNLT
jgi:hypothetical protein